VGRDAELRRLRTVLDEAVSGASCFVLVEGEPGIGKTRLLEEAAQHAAAQGVRVVWGRCPESEHAPALWPWLEVTRALLDDLPDEQRSVVVGEELAALLGPADGPPLPGDQRFRLYDAVGRALEQLSARRPVLVVLEDLHWADAASAHLLRALTARLYDAPLAVVGSLRELELGRDDAVVAAVAAVTRRSGGSRLRLRGLAEAESRALVEQAVGAAVPAHIASAVHARADGNPFYATELARLLASEGGLTGGSADVAGALPSGVRDVVRRRLSGLGEPTTRLLALAAVLGREIDLAVLVAAEGGDGDDCLDALEPALASRIVLAVPDAPARFRFAHALVREVVLDGLTPLRRARLHARAADAVLAVHGDTDDTCEQVAHHLWSSTALGGARRAAEQLERAAEVAVRRFSYESADDLLERAAGLRRAYGGDAVEDEAELVTLVRLAALRRMTTGLPTGHLVVPQDRCKELAYRTGRLDLYAGLLWAEWAAAVTATRFQLGGEVLTQIQALCRGAGPGLQAMSHHCTGVHLWHVGRLQEAAAELQRAHELMGEPPDSGAPTVLDSWFEAAPLGWSFYTFVGELAGQVHDGRQRYARQLRWAGDNPYHLLVTCSMEAGSLVCAGDWAGAAEIAGRATALAKHVPSDFFAGSALVYVGWGLAQQGEPERGLELVERGARLFRGTGARTCQGLILAPRADVLRLLGRPQEALTAARYAEDEVVASGEPWSRPLAVFAVAGRCPPSVPRPSRSRRAGPCGRAGPGDRRPPARAPGARDRCRAGRAGDGRAAQRRLTRRTSRRQQPVRVPPLHQPREAGHGCPRRPPARPPVRAPRSSRGRRPRAVLRRRTARLRRGRRGSAGRTPHRPATLDPPRHRAA
jgi:hypothetical protein